MNIPTAKDVATVKMAYDAVHNPMNIFSGDQETGRSTDVHIDQHPLGANEVDCSVEELEVLESWAKKLRMVYLGIASFLIATCLLSFISISVSSIFIALYVLMFSCLICCYECAFSRAVVFIVQNFGFLYNSPGRFSFLIFVAVMAFSLGMKRNVYMINILAVSCSSVPLRHIH